MLLGSLTEPLSFYTECLRPPLPSLKAQCPPLDIGHLPVWWSGDSRGPWGCVGWWPRVKHLWASAGEPACSRAASCCRHRLSFHQLSGVPRRCHPLPSFMSACQNDGWGVDPPLLRSQVYGLYDSHFPHRRYFFPLLTLRFWMVVMVRRVASRK